MHRLDKVPLRATRVAVPIANNCWLSLAVGTRPVATGEPYELGSAPTLIFWPLFERFNSIECGLV